MGQGRNLPSSDLQEDGGQAARQQVFNIINTLTLKTQVTIFERTLSPHVSLWP